jgi:hypothetical protein
MAQVNTDGDVHNGLRGRGRSRDVA